MDQNQKIIEALQELKLASINDGENAMRRYDMLFLGSKMNEINSIELRHSLEKVFNIQLTLDELNSLVPKLCGALGMNYQPLKALDDLHASKAHCFLITLYE